MKLVEITSKNDVELVALGETLRRQIAEAAVEVRTKNVTNRRAIREVKQSLARVLTILREREIVKEEQL